jgi:hypothetical protein
MARVRHTVKAMEGDGSPSNQEERPASPVVADLPLLLHLHHPAQNLVRFLVWMGLLALVRAAVPHIYLE